MKKKSSILLLALSIVLILATSINSAIAYFTSYVNATGGYVIHLGGTSIREDLSDWTKKVVITNEPDGQPVYVRARAFAGDAYTLTYAGNGWSYGWLDKEKTKGDGYYYYDEILYPGEETTELGIHIDNIPKSDEISMSEHFNVVVIYETSPVQYDGAGNPYADWNLTQRGDA